ncbi:hypothetical protein PIB30_059438 [Stylosanthes scabra]|uniref:Wax synthase domain-containing protein n=1 Tax=Stylosanthes scabra TaxID=79078 RepID=A0ABU6VKI5_9FABA|nr:hypothetical protein [Stylosanthes scabra]
MDGGDLIMLTVVTHGILKRDELRTKRLLFIAPIICFYLFIPFNFSSVHLRGNTGFFFGWLGTFKLILFAFNKGPLSSDPSISLVRFVAAASLPIKIQQNEQHIRSKTSHIKPRFNPSNPNQLYQNGPLPPDPSIRSKSSDFGTNPSSSGPEQRKDISNQPQQSDQIHPKVILGMYCFHIYFMLDMLLATFAALAKTLLGMELEPQFNKPLLSTSLQDFWGRRWNLMVTSILRPAVYQPSVRVAMIVVSPKLAPLPAVFVTFVVSGGDCVKEDNCIHVAVAEIAVGTVDHRIRCCHQLLAVPARVHPLSP